MTMMLFFGLLLGLRHALEADHVAAVATLVNGNSGLGAALRQGAAWGIGHTLTLLLFGSVVIWMDGVVPMVLARWLELAVGVMLVGLGVDVLRRLYRDRIHFHLHQHTGGERHFHAHSHRGERPAGHDTGRHRHGHRALVGGSGLPLRALLIGAMHGLAGSAALILLTLETVHGPWTGMLYMALFGVGSIIGMAALSVVIAVPMRRSAHGLSWVHNGLQLVVGCVTVMIGAGVVVEMLTAGSAI